MLLLLCQISVYEKFFPFIFQSFLPFEECIHGFVPVGHEDISALIGLVHLFHEERRNDKGKTHV
ncbi:hypothetical protein ACE6H2_028568 [Prunus campanulata]